MFSKGGVCGAGSGGVLGGAPPHRYSNKNVRGTLPPLTHGALLAGGGGGGGGAGGSLANAGHHLVARGVNGHDLICMKDDAQNGVNHYSGEAGRRR